MFRTARNIAVIAGMLLIVGCNQQDADALAKIGNLMVERTKSLPELKSPKADKNKPNDEKEEPRTK